MGIKDALTRFIQEVKAIPGNLGSAMTVPRRSRAVRPYQDMGNTGISRFQTAEDYLRAQDYSVFVFSCIHIRSSALAKTKLQAVDPDGNLVFGPKIAEKNRKHPLYRLLERPNPVQSGYEFKYMVNQYLDLVGNSLVLMDGVNAGTGQPTALWPLDPTRCSPNYDGTYNYKMFERQPDGKDFIVIPGNWVIHFKRPNPQNIYWGQGIAQTLNKEINISAALSEYTAQFFNQGAQLSGILTTDLSLDDDAFNRLRAEAIASLTGQRNAHKLAVMDNGLKFQQTSATLKDIGVAELDTLTLKKIFMAFGVPPGRLGLTEFSNWTVADLDRVFNETIETIAVEFEDGLNKLARLYDKAGGAIPDDERQALLDGQLFDGDVSGLTLQFVLPNKVILKDLVAAAAQIDGMTSLPIEDKVTIIRNLLSDLLLTDRSLGPAPMDAMNDDSMMDNVSMQTAPMESMLPAREQG